MISSCVSISGPTRNAFAINHPKLISSISCSFPESKKCYCRFSSSKILAAGVDFPIEGNAEEKVGRKNLLQAELMPKHLAVIMDGNRRWAFEKGLTVQDGYRAGRRTMEAMARLCHGMGIEILTVFAFSTENWLRPKEEVDFLMSLLEEQPKECLDMAMEVGARISIIGDTSKLPESPRMGVKALETITKENKGPHVLVALNYGGRQDVIEATKAIANKIKDGSMLLEEINEKSFEKELQTKCTDFFPCPDLLIRTSGEKRISNFMIWQLAYTELHFVDKFFPDLEEDDVVEAIISFQQRKCRWGL